MGDYLLSSSHSHLYIGRGEYGLNDRDSSSKASPSRNKRNLPKGLDTVIKSVIDLCNNSGGKSKAEKHLEDLAIEN